MQLAGNTMIEYAGCCEHPCLTGIVALLHTVWQAK